MTFSDPELGLYLHISTVHLTTYLECRWYK